jgi:hypothetical protein
MVLFMEQFPAVCPSPCAFRSLIFAFRRKLISPENLFDYSAAINNLMERSKEKI